MSGWRTANGKVTIHRSSETEIDKAIADLEKRGYVLVEKKPATKGLKNTTNTAESEQRYLKLDGSLK